MTNSNKRSSIPSSSSNPSHLSVPPIKVTHKKRSKSLGGALVQHHNSSHDNFTEPIELTPRKKARRSLVPGKSILKSRPTVTGLERTTSENLMNTVKAHTQPITHSNSLPSDTNGLAYTSSSSTWGLAQNETRPLDQLTNQPPKTSRDDDDAESNASSDMELSNGVVSRRVSAASNTTTSNFRRVSFAAKAHVRTFGSPMVDQQSSSPPPSSSPSKDPNRSSASQMMEEDDGGERSADMSIEDFSAPDPVLPPANSSGALTLPARPETATTHHLGGNQGSESSGSNPITKLPHQPHKPSRLSTVFASLGQPDLDDDDNDDDVEMEDADSTVGQPTEARSSSEPPSKTVDQNLISDQTPILPPSDPPVSEPSHPKQSVASDQLPALPQVPSFVPKLHPPRSGGLGRAPILPPNPAFVPKPSESVPPHRDNPTEDTDLTSPSPVVPHKTPNASQISHIPRPSHIIGREPTRRQSSATDLLKRLKSSRLSMALPEYSREDTDHTENAAGATSDTLSWSGTTRSRRTSLASSAFPASTDRIEPLSQQATAPSSLMNEEVPRKSSRLTLHFPDYDDDDETEQVETTKVLDVTGDFIGPTAPSLKPSRLTLSFPEYEDYNEEDQPEVGPSGTQIDQFRKSTKESSKKSSRLTFALPGIDDPDEEETMDLDHNARKSLNPRSDFGPTSMTSVNKNQTSRLSGFFSTDDLPPDEDGSRDLIDFTEPLTVADPAPTNFDTPSEDVTDKVTGPTDLSTSRLSSITEAPERSNALVPDKHPADDPTIFQDPHVPSQPCDPAPPPRPVLPLGPLLLHRRTSASPSRRSGRLSSPRARRSIEPTSIEAPPDLRRIRPSFPMATATNITPPEMKPARVSSQLAITTTIPPSTSSGQAPPPHSFKLDEFFEHAGLRFFNLAQPRVREDQSNPDSITGEPASFGRQVYAGMIKIPRVRMLEAAARTLRMKTESLTTLTSEHANDLEVDPQRSDVLTRWLQLRGYQPRESSATDMEGLTSLLDQLRVQKTCAELRAKKDGIEFEFKNRQAYQADLNHRKEKLAKDLEMMKKLCEVVGPSMDDLRAHKQGLVDEIRKRKEKNEEIAKCDQGLLQALKEETKDLGMAVEVMRSTLAESEFEKNLWKEKVDELESEKKELLAQIEQWTRKGDGKGVECTTQELIRLKNEFAVLQNMMGWEVVRFDNDRLEFVLWGQIGVAFWLVELRDRNSNGNRKVNRIELKWLKNTLSTSSSSDEDQDSIGDTIDRYLFSRVNEKYRDRGFEAGGRVKDYVHQISSIWYLARELKYELLNVKRRFRVNVKVDNNQSVMKVITKLNGRSNSRRVGVEVIMELSGEEILDIKSSTESVVAGIACRVVSAYESVDSKALTYVAREALDQSSGRGALRRSCEEVLSVLESGER